MNSLTLVELLEIKSSNATTQPQRFLLINVETSDTV